LAHAAWENAVGLLDDAKLLLDAGRFPRAFALAELAAEELGKVILVAAMAVRVAVGMPPNWSRFWGKFLHHPDKAWNASLIDRVMAVNAKAWAEGDVDAIKADTKGVEEARKQAEGMPHAKNDALYVDYRGGQLRLPLEAISDDQARTIVSGMDQLIASLKARGFPPGRGLLPKAAANPEFARRFRPKAERFDRVDSPKDVDG
jgi:AbiV family abortive infection protein